MNREQLFKMHEETCAKALATMRKKNHDYASGDDPFQNFNGSEIYGIHRVKGLLLRVGDKLQRINTFVDKGKLEVANESVDDAIEDIINYMILAKGMLAAEVNNKENSIDPIKQEFADIKRGIEEDWHPPRPGTKAWAGDYPAEGR